MRPGAMTEDGREFGVKLGECGPKGALTGRVGTAPEVAGHGMRYMRKKIAKGKCAHRLAVRLPSRLACYRGSLSSTVHRPEGPAHIAAGCFSLLRGTRDTPSRCTTCEQLLKELLFVTH